MKRKVKTVLDLIIVADDLTGAIDTGIQFEKNGYRTLVTTEPLALSDCIDPAIRVLVVSTTSRHLPAKDAYMRVYNAVAAAKSWGVHLFYKKTDSALRGNIGAELTAMMKASGYRQLVFAPALPELQRTVRNGIIYIDNRPLSQSAYRNDPLSPVISDYVPKIIAQQTDVPAHLCSPEQLAEHHAEECILLMDAQTDGELREIVQAVRDNNMSVAFAGCAGLAAALPALLPAPGIISRRQLAPADRLLFVCGSINEASMEQVRKAEAAGVPLIRLCPEQYLAPDFLQSEAFRKLIHDLRIYMDQAGVAVLYTAKSSVQAAEAVTVAKRRNVDMEGLHLKIADRIGETVAEILNQVPVSAATVFGGDTLLGILKHTGCSNVSPEAELLPGVVQTRTKLNGRDMVLISKSGGFGSGDTIMKVMQAYGMGLQTRRLENE